MQGRLCPDNINILQCFPKQDWQKEFQLAEKIGFEAIELLYDKNQVCLNFPLKEPVLNISTNTACLDRLCLFSILKDSSKFLAELEKAIDFYQEQGVTIYIIPLFEENFIDSKKDFITALKLIEKSSIWKTYTLSLEISLAAEDIIACLSEIDIDIGICYDVGNACSLGFIPQNEILVLKDQINHVHFKDRAVDGPNVMFGCGEVDFIAVINSLKSIQYNGLVIFESKYFEDAYLEQIMNYQYISKILEK